MTAALRRAIFVRAREIGLDDGERRALQLRATGVASLTRMSEAQMRAVLDEMRAPGSGDALPDHAMTPLLRALWISGWHLGAVRDRSDRALCRFVAQALGVDAARFAGRRLAAAVEELKRMLARDAGVDWSPGRCGPRVRVIEAQWRLLAELGAVRIHAGLDHHVSRALGIGVRSVEHLTDAQADEAIAMLGGRLRRARAKAASG